MAEREPALLRDQVDGSADARPDARENADTEPTAAPKAQTTEPMHAAPKSGASSEPMHVATKSTTDKAARESTSTASTEGRRAPVVHVVGFWKRAIAACVDLAIVIPTALLVTFLASKISGVRLPSEKLHLLDIDLWIDLVLATDPAIVMGIVLFLAVGITYLFVFHLLQGRTLGMRLMKMRIIDVYGDRPSPARCAARCAGYLASVATLFLGFLWMGFDSEKRGLQDWLAGTYVIRA
jgi:resuscitation-promoting factor RpfA